MDKRYISYAIASILMIFMCFSGCTVPEIKQVGKAIDSYKQISGNLYYDSLSEDLDVYKISYNAIGERNIEKFKKNGKEYCFNVVNGEVYEKGSILITETKNTYIKTTNSKSTITTFTENNEDNKESSTLLTSLATTVKTTTKATTKTTVKTTKKPTTIKTTTRYYPPKTTTRYYPPKTTKKTTIKTTKKQATTKIFIFEGEKYYIDENGRWIKVK